MDATSPSRRAREFREARHTDSQIGNTLDRAFAAVSLEQPSKAYSSDKIDRLLDMAARARRRITESLGHDTAASEVESANENRHL